MNFGVNLKKYRLMRNLKQEDLAQLINISRSNISKYENNEIEPSLGVILQLSKVLGVDPNTLLGVDTDYISPREAFIDDANFIDNVTVEHSWKKYINQFYISIMDILEDSPPTKKANVCIILSDLLDMFSCSEDNVKRTASLQQIIERLVIANSSYASNNNILNELSEQILTLVMQSNGANTKDH